MFGIAYLSTENRRQIDQLTKKIEATNDSDEASAMREKIAHLNEQTKPYMECTLEELNDLRIQLYEKHDKLNGIRKGHLAQQFSMMITIVEEYMRTIIAKTALENSKKKTPEEAADGIKKTIRPNPGRTKFGKDRWTARIDSES